MSRRDSAQLEAHVAACADRWTNHELRHAPVAVRLVMVAFLAGMPASERSDSTDGRRYMLHGNVIAEWRDGPSRGTRELWISDAGWPTPTTRGRLRALPGVVRLDGFSRGKFRHQVVAKAGQGCASGNWTGGFLRILTTYAFGKLIEFDCGRPWLDAEEPTPLQGDFRRGAGQPKRGWQGGGA